MPTPTAGDALAQQLLDAQVRFHLAAFDGDRLAGTVSGLVQELFDAAGTDQLDDLVDREAIKQIVARSLVEVPGSAAVGGIVELVTAVVMQGPETPYPVGELVDRAHVEAVLDELLALTPLLERILERLTASPLVGTMASRFMGRIVGEVLAANKAVAGKVPGLGSLMSVGTSAASSMMGVADKQLAGLIGDTVGKGGTLAVRRLNRILVETLKDPTTREAILQVWDLAAEGQVAGAAEHVSEADVSGLVDALHDAAIATAGNQHVIDLSDAIVEGFFDRFGGYTPTELLEEFDIFRADLVADLVRLAPRIIDAARESGHLERILRARLEPFYASDQVRGILG